MLTITGLCHLHPAVLLTMALSMTMYCPACAPSKQSPPSCSRTVSTPCGLYQVLPGTPYDTWSGVCAEWRSIKWSKNGLVLSLLPAPQTASPSSPPLGLQYLKILSTACQIVQKQSTPTPTQSPRQTILTIIQIMLTFTMY